MREESVTKYILRYLIDNGWSVICFDFPQSGTGRVLHPNGQVSKTQGVIVPDVLAVRSGLALYLENKDRYYPADFQKVHDVLAFRQYSEAFDSVLAGQWVERIIGGIGLPKSKYNDDCISNSGIVDVVLCVGDDGSVEIMRGKGLI